MSDDRRIARRLRRERAALSRSAEARIRRELLIAAAQHERPERLRLSMALYFVCGLLLLGLAAAAAAGAGPLAF